jgi:hypothetical protein
MKQYPIVVPFIFEWMMDLFIEINTHRYIFIGVTIINVFVAYLFIKNRRLVRVLKEDNEYIEYVNEELSNICNELEEKNELLESACLQLDEMRNVYRERLDNLIHTMIFVYCEQQGIVHEFKCSCADCTLYYDKLYMLMFYDTRIV